MFCPRCGTDLAEGSVFCPKCGVQLRAQPVSSYSIPKKQRRRSNHRALKILLFLFIVGGIAAAAESNASTNNQATAPAGSSAAAVAPSDTPVPLATDTPIPPPTPTLTNAQWDAQSSGDTYRQVADHPDTTNGDAITWKCNIAKFLGTDDSSVDTYGWQEIGCWVYEGTYTGGLGEGEAILLVSPLFDTTSMDSGDDITVRGTVGDPYQATNGFGATITLPTIQVAAIDEFGHDPAAS